jgi:PAS domain S-box-containing protein
VGSDQAADGVHDPDIARLLIDSVSDYAIFVLDPRGFVRTWNRGAERLKGYRRSEIVGKHFSTFYTEDARTSGVPDSLLVRAEREGSVQHSGWRVRRDGSRFWGHVTITALRDDTGELLGFAKVTRDLTETHEHEEALGRALARERATATELDRVNRARSRLLAAVVHDLSAPITVVRSSLELLATGLDPADHDAVVAQARRNADDLEQLRSQLVEFSRLEAGVTELARKRIELADLVAHVVDDVATVLAVPVEVELDATAAVEADELAVRRVLINLLTNAARFSPPGRPVRIRTAPADGGDQVAVGVADEGPGIAVEDRERVFGEFWAGRGRARPGGGLGLGLTIVQGYVHEHGGRVWIEGGPGQGTTFWFTLPVAGNDAAGTRPAP